MSTDRKQYIVTKNLSSFIKSEVRNEFEFTAKLENDDVHEVIPGFDCFKTLSFDGSTKYMIKHKCLIPAAARAEQVVHQGLMDKYLSKKPVIQKQDKEKMKEKFII